MATLLGKPGSVSLLRLETLNFLCFREVGRKCPVIGMLNYWLEVTMSANYHVPILGTRVSWQGLLFPLEEGAEWDLQNTVPSLWTRSREQRKVCLFHLWAWNTQQLPF